jgi:hypothetical protein
MPAERLVDCWWLVGGWLVGGHFLVWLGAWFGVAVWRGNPRLAGARCANVDDVIHSDC